MNFFRNMNENFKDERRNKKLEKARKVKEHFLKKKRNITDE